MADLDGDNAPDVVTANGSSRNVTVLINLCDAGPSAPECNDGLDNDGDGGTDAGDDPGCFGPEGTLEDPECDDHIDNDGDGFCDTAGSTCMDGSTPGDPGCLAPWSNLEDPECDDGINNDPAQDALIDGADPECTRASDNAEACGLGFELVFLLPLLMWCRRRRRCLLHHDRD
jgi:hypothetical protein